jgi:hypothetical protein
VGDTVGGGLSSSGDGKGESGAPAVSIGVRVSSGLLILFLGGEG